MARCIFISVGPRLPIQDAAPLTSHARYVPLRAIRPARSLGRKDRVATPTNNGLVDMWSDRNESESSGFESWSRRARNRRHILHRGRSSEAGTSNHGCSHTHSGHQDGPQAPRPAPAGYGRLHPVSFHGRGAAGQERPSRRAYGHGRHRDRSLHGFHAVRCCRSALVRPRPLPAVEWPRLDAALQPALPDRRQGHDAGRVEAVPPDQ
jgi:hypothetical protein